MKNYRIPHTQRRGLVTILNVVVISGFLLGVMAVVYRASIRALEGQKKVQLQLDYEAREQAFLRSVVTLAPLYAANTMMDQSDGAARAEFDDMFSTAMTWSSMAEARTDAEETAMNFTGARNGNVADASVPANLGVKDIVGSDANANAGDIPSGVGAAVQAGYPDPLLSRVASAATNSVSSPLISSDITYNQASNAGDDRDYSLLDYPNIHFEYTDGNFIARQNWWVMDVHSHQKDWQLTGAGVTTKVAQNVVDTGSNGYILSLYEIPSQLAISSSAITNLGQIAGTAYGGNVNIQGNVYAKQANVQGGTYDGISTTAGADFSAASTVGGAAVASGLTASQARDTATTFEANNIDENTNLSNYYPISRASDYARSLFLPINPGLEFFDSFASTAPTAQGAANRLSRDSWNEYTRGCHQCRMKLTVVRDANQNPETLTFTYVDANKDDILNPIVITKQTPSAGQIDWNTVDTTTFPFSESNSADGNPLLEVDIEKLIVWLEDIDGDVGTPIDFAVNHSLLVNVFHDGVDTDLDNTDDPIASPTNNTDMAVGLKGGSNLTAFTNGFSLVTSSRLYMLDDLNVTMNTGVNDPVYPPLSIFAPAIRFGDGSVGSQIVVDGQIGSLSTSGSGVDILDLKNAGSTTANAAAITANLTSLDAVNQLPPVNVMNWLVVIQKKD